MSGQECDFCTFLVSDEETGEEYCAINLDEDDLEKFLSGSSDSCPYFRSDNEYDVVKHQN